MKKCEDCNKHDQTVEIQIHMLGNPKLCKICVAGYSNLLAKTFSHKNPSGNSLSELSFSSTDGNRKISNTGGK